MKNWIQIVTDRSPGTWINLDHVKLIENVGGIAGGTKLRILFTDGSEEFAYDPREEQEIEMSLVGIDLDADFWQPLVEELEKIRGVLISK